MIKIWLQAARLRTLPLAASGIICGISLAAYHETCSWAVSALALLTALLLQILSNFANDYGDYVKGTDNADRVGPERTLQSGGITTAGMKRAIVLTACLALASGVALVILAAPLLTSYAWVAFLILGLLAIAAAVLYTVGERAYGYRGLGDVMVFIFFGLASVLGSYYLNAGQLSLNVWLIAIGVGCLSTGVINLNNMRDIDNDIASGKMTVAARLGLAKAKNYHGLLVSIAVACFCYVTLTLNSGWIFLFLIGVPIFLLFKDVRAIKKITDKSQLDPFLKKLALGTFMLTIAFSLSLFISHLIS